MASKKKPYIVIKNFRKYQHYQEGSRPIAWLKLYIKEILFGEEFFHLKEFDRWVFIGLMLLAGLKNNKIPYEKKYLKAKILHYETDENLLEKSINSLIKRNLIAIKMLAKRYQDASTDKDKEEDKEYIYNIYNKEKEKKELFFPKIREYFTSAYKRKFNSEPAIDFGKDGKVVKKSAGLFKNIEDAYRLIDDFLESKKAEECGYTLSVCFSTHTINLWKAGKLLNLSEDELFEKFSKKKQ